ncbi:MAG: bifunctional diaminohydroxyphosphoribosylaminopyrimidine deaminase/5-amino-6-(5-phosphoribosylamino)uracil reductase RibD [Candidatus Omnitrophota bacterium]|nr:MAG: bifunctional diaminohydroxyphosphoribosylaminopyrimidine deaminase/5-amino-6-(5-phosphoribosylamino)uracil reductase RibD [Candidatus Omnitrophota bacterium]
MDKTDLCFLDTTIALAKKGEGKTSPNPLVGAVIVKQKQIISEGTHYRCGASHAEINALRKAGAKAKGATIYVNLEPCSHFGQTPPCVQAIIKAGIKRVVIGMKDPNPLNNGRGIRQLRSAGIKVELAIEQQKFKKFNEIFIKYITIKLPFVIVKTGQSLDGKIAGKNGESKWITGKRARNYAQSIRNRVDGIMVGINTLLQDDPYLSCRYKGRLKKDNPIKIIVDTHLRTPLNARIFSSDSPAKVIIAVTEKADAQRISLFKDKGINLILCPFDQKGRIDLRFLLTLLAQQKITSILVEGGGKLIGSCFDEALVDYAYFFIAPKIIGGVVAPNSVAGNGVSCVQKAITLKNARTDKIGVDFLVCGDIVYH